MSPSSTYPLVLARTFIFSEFMNYYFLGERAMSIFKEMFSSVEKFAASTVAGLAAVYAPVGVPILALSGIIAADQFYEFRVNNKKKDQDLLTQLKNISLGTFYKLRDSVVAICGAFTIEKFIITSINIHAVEFIAGAIALVEFWSLLDNLSVIHPSWKIWGLLKRKVKKEGEELLDMSLDNELPDDNNNKNIS